MQIELKEFDPIRKSKYEMFSRELWDRYGKTGTLDSNNHAISQNSVIVRTLTGESIQAEFVSTTDTTATYLTSSGKMTLRKDMILSVQKLLNSPMNESVTSTRRLPNKIAIKEYKALPALIFTIAGGVWSFTLFKDAKDYHDAATALNSLGSAGKSAADAANNKGDQKFNLGLGASVVSAIFFFIAIHPTVTYIEQPVTVVPSSDGIQLVIHF
jgi:hypothetical protein